MGFIFDGLDTETYNRQYSDNELYKRIYKYFKPNKKLLNIIVLTLTLNSIAGIMAPVLVSKSVDLVTTNKEIPLMVILSLSIVCVGIMGFIFNYFCQNITAKVVSSVVLKLREDVLNKVLALDHSFYDRNLSGKIVSRVTADTQGFSNVINLIVDFFSQLFLVLLLAIWLLCIDLYLALIIISMAPVALFIAVKFRKIARSVTRNSRSVNASITSQIQESISGIMIAKTFRQEKKMYENFKENNRKAYQIGLRRGIIMNLLFPIMSFMSILGSALLVYVGGYFIKTKGLSLGNWYLFMQAVSYFWWPLLNVAAFWSQFQDGLSAAERVFSILDTESLVKQTDNQNIETLIGKIEFKNVQFSYSNREIVLPRFNLQIKAGETIALVGHTGAGKSSVAKLIGRFYEYQKGEISIDGKDIRSLDLAQYCKKIGFVTQNPILFNGTVKDNIFYGNKDATLDDINRAISHLGKGDWLGNLPNGINSPVGINGNLISFGQRQLIALTRIFLKNPAIFILDEAISSVDPFTEASIQKALDSVMKDRTAIVIAHRLSTIRNADRILVLNNGEIVEQGTHENLFMQNMHYKDLYQTYYRHQDCHF